MSNKERENPEITEKPVLEFATFGAKGGSKGEIEFTEDGHVLRDEWEELKTGKEADVMSIPLENNSRDLAQRRGKANESKQSKGMEMAD